MGLLLRVIYTGDQKEFVQSCNFLGFDRHWVELFILEKLM